jgi:hypothetical protein
LSTIGLSYWYFTWHFVTVLPIIFIPFFVRLLWFISCFAGFGYVFFYGWVTLLNDEIIPETCSDSNTFRACFAGLASISLIAVWMVLTSLGTQIHTWVWCCMNRGGDDAWERTQNEAAWAQERRKIRHMRAKSEAYQLNTANPDVHNTSTTQPT